MLRFQNMPRKPDRNRRRRRPSHGDQRPHGERKDKRGIAHESSAPRKSIPLTPRQLKSVERLLSGIGVPEPRPLKPDAFQLEALAAINENLSAHPDQRCRRCRCSECKHGCNSSDDDPAHTYAPQAYASPATRGQLGGHHDGPGTSGQSPGESFARYPQSRDPNLMSPRLNE